MTLTARQFTIAEAAVVSGISRKAIDNAIVKQVIPTGQGWGTARPATGIRVSRRPRKLSQDEIVLLKLFLGAEVTIPVATKERVVAQLKADRQAREVRAGEYVVLDVAAARDSVIEGLRTLEEAEHAVLCDEEVMGGEPVFKGTRIPVHSIAAMLDAGAKAEEILSGYPKLDHRLLGLARIWAKAHPQRGRPRRPVRGDLRLRSRRSYPREKSGSGD